MTKSEERTSLTDASPAASAAFVMAADAHEETTHVAIASIAATGPARQTHSLVRESAQAVPLADPKFSGLTRQLMTHEGWCREPGTVPRVQMPAGAADVSDPVVVGMAATAVETTGDGDTPSEMVAWELIRDTIKPRSRIVMRLKFAAIVRFEREAL